PARTPMLVRHDIARLRLEFGTNFATPGPVFEGLARPSRPLNWRYVLPSLVIPGPVSTMQRIKNSKPRLTCTGQDLQHLVNAVVDLRDPLQAIPKFASFRNKIVVGINHNECSDLFFIGHTRHASSSRCAGLAPSRTLRGLNKQTERLQRADRNVLEHKVAV